MKILFHKEPKYLTPQIVICNHELNQEVKELQEKITQIFTKELVVYDEYGATLVPIADIVRIYSENQKVYVQTQEMIGSLRERLYSIEEKLTEHKFIRISNSELVNMHKIKRLDTSMTGTIKMELVGNLEAFVSRRNVSKIKKVLGI